MQKLIIAGMFYEIAKKSFCNTVIEFNTSVRNIWKEYSDQNIEKYMLSVCMRLSSFVRYSNNVFVLSFRNILVLLCKCNCQQIEHFSLTYLYLIESTILSSQIGQQILLSRIIAYLLFVDVRDVK